VLRDLAHHGKGDGVLKSFSGGALVVAWFGLSSEGAIAHHSISGQFDLDNRGELMGVISDVEWINPHIYIHLDVTDDKGVVATWRVESVPIAMLRKGRITKAMLMADGQPVTIEVLHARDGTPHLAYALRLIYADGRTYKLAAEAE
jgi:hypothetical protein